MNHFLTFKNRAVTNYSRLSDMSKVNTTITIIVICQSETHLLGRCLALKFTTVQMVIIMDRKRIQPKLIVTLLAPRWHHTR